MQTTRPASKLPLPADLHADAYLQWAVQSGFRYFSADAERDTVLLVRFRTPVSHAMRKHLDTMGLRISQQYDGYTCATVTTRITRQVPEFIARLDALRAFGLEAIELAAPIAPPGVPDECLVVDRAKVSRTVLGVIDDGCPFAHQDYRQNKLAVHYIWNQGGQVTGAIPWATPSPFGYGTAYTRTALDQIMAAATAPAGTVDEDAAYALAGLPSLRSASSHGAQVMSHLAGCARTGSPLQNMNRPAQKLPGSAEMVFVQLPADALDDPSGRWLPHFALDGLQAIRFYAREMGPHKADNVIVNLSYGTQTGPHDGTSVMERAIDELTRKAATQGYEFLVTLPSGNSHLARTHAQFDLARNGGTIDWFVAPDTQTPAFLEIWLPPNVTLSQVKVSVEVPGQADLVAQANSIVSDGRGTTDMIAIDGPAGSGHSMVLIAVAPTTHPLEAGAPVLALATSGRRRVTVQPLTSGALAGIAHAYLARCDANMGRRPRGHSGYLDCAAYDPNRFMRADVYLNPTPPTAPADVMAYGSMTGTSTSKEAKVAAGYILSRREPTHYSAGGPSRGPRIGPDWAYPADQSVVLLGLPGGGNRSATVLRLVGTSIAAPQYARQLAFAQGGPLPPVPPTPPAPWVPNRAGKGLR
jgi:hypothetical protein